MSSRLASCALTSLAKRMGQMGLSNTSASGSSSLHSNGLALAATRNYFCCSGQRLMLVNNKGSSLVNPTSLMPSLSGFALGAIENNRTCNSPTLQTNRTFATRKKRLEKRRKRRLAEKHAQKKEEQGVVEESSEEQAAPQHAAWVGFQKSLTVGEFQTGQTTKARVQQKGESGQKLRDLKRREKLEMRIAAKQGDLADVRGGEYPVGRYSDEETERLLKMAYAAIPPRAGKRGTRNLKRQKRRWFLVRKIRAKAKAQKIAAHYRNMEKRSQRFKELKTIKSEAPNARARDRDYQREVLRRWVENLQSYDDDYAKRELIQAEATLIKDKSNA